MKLSVVIEEIAAKADDFLDGVTSREQARAAISEVITLDYRQAVGNERTAVIDGVMRILEGEGFFDDLAKGTDAKSDDDED